MLPFPSKNFYLKFLLWSIDYKRHDWLEFILKNFLIFVCNNFFNFEKEYVHFAYVNMDPIFHTKNEM
jgi:hypothetical protein